MKNTIVSIKGKPLQNENKNKWNIQREENTLLGRL